MFDKKHLPAALNSRNILAFLLGLLVAYLGYYFLAANVYGYSHDLQQCNRIENEKLQVECAQSIIDRALEEHGIERALEAFHHANEVVVAFKGFNCHHHAHALGDELYQEVFVARGGDVDDVTIPRELNFCTRGVYHYLFKNIIFNTPDPEYAVETCRSIEEKFGSTTKVISSTCYQGVGHGFALHGIYEATTSGSFDPINRVPFAINLCSELPGASESEKNRCYSGVFNVIIVLMLDGEYGYEFSEDSLPFGMCERLPKETHKECYRQIGYKLDGLAELNVQKLAAILAPVKERSSFLFAFGAGVENIAKVIGAGEVIKQCSNLGEELFDMCITAAVEGEYENILEKDQLHEVLAVCELPDILEKEATKSCYQKVLNFAKGVEFPEVVSYLCSEMSPALAPDECASSN